MQRLLTILIFSFFLLPGMTFGQTEDMDVYTSEVVEDEEAEEDDAFEGEKRPRTEDAVGFRAVSLNVLRESLFYRDSEGVWPLNIVGKELGPIHWMDPTASLTLYRRLVTGEGREYEPVVQMNVPEDARTFLVVLAAGLGDYRARSYDIGLDKQPLNSIRYINLAPFQIGLALDDQRLLLEAGEDSMQKLSPEKKSVRVEVATLHQEEPRTLSSARYSLIPGFRLLLLGTLRGRSLEQDMPYQIITHRDKGPIDQ